MAVPLSQNNIPHAALQRLAVRHFRCFESRQVEFQPGLNFIIGPNARGKTSLLEAACILLRLQSQRVTSLANAIQHGRHGFVTDGYFAGRHLQFYYSPQRKKLALDSVEQKQASEWLSLSRVVWFGNQDIDLLRGSGEKRRRFLDFTALQLEPTYRIALRSYEHALRSRNHLLKMQPIRWNEVAAFDGPLLQHGAAIVAARNRLVAGLQQQADIAHQAISGHRESLRLQYLPGDQGNFTSSLAAARSEDARLRQTTIGPHRDDVAFYLNEIPSADTSEGQQRTLVLALKLASARLLEAHFSQPPVLLIDDIFGELDQARRNALLVALPAHSQKIVTTTHLDWFPGHSTLPILRLSETTT